VEIRARGRLLGNRPNCHIFRVGGLLRVRVYDQAP
jgi:hypothetical protein